MQLISDVNSVSINYQVGIYLCFKSITIEKNFEQKNLPLRNASVLKTMGGSMYGSCNVEELSELEGSVKVCCCVAISSEINKQTHKNLPPCSIAFDDQKILETDQIH